MIIATLSALPVHAGLGNQSVVRKANRILDWINDGNITDPPGPPLCLQNDGDLWVIFTNIVRARGAHSIAVSKVKGHASDAYVGTNQQLATHKIGNDQADRLATSARKDCHGDLLQFLPDFSASRYEGYTNLLFWVHNFISSTYYVYQKTRQALA